MPEPNLPPIVLFDDTNSDISAEDDAINIDDLRRRLPSLPSEERTRLINNYGISYEAADRLLVIIYFCILWFLCDTSLNILYCDYKEYEMTPFFFLFIS